MEAAAGSIFAVGRFVDDKGDPIGNSFAPELHLLAAAAALRDARLRGGAQAAHAVRGLDRHADGRHRRPEWATGSGSPARTRRGHTTWSGLTKLGDTSFGGAGIAQVVLPEAQRITDREGQFDQISVAAADGVTPRAAARPHRARHAAARCRWRPARRRRSASPTTSTRTSASSRSRCSCSPACRCSWARSRSSTRSRSRSRSARASSGCSGRSAPRATRSSASVGIEALTARHRSARRSGLAAGSASRSAINELFKAVGIDLPNTGTVVSTRTVVVSLIVGVLVTLVAALAPGAPRHAHHADGRAARGGARGHEGARPRRDRGGRRAGCDRPRDDAASGCSAASRTPAARRGSWAAGRR